MLENQGQSDVVGIGDTKEELGSVEKKELNIFSEEDDNDKTKYMLQSKENMSYYSSIDDTIISSNLNDELIGVTWSGKATETFYWRLLTNNYVRPDNFEQIIVQRIHDNDNDYVRDIFYYVFNSDGKIVYDFMFPNTRAHQIVYFTSNSHVFSNLPAGIYKCAISEYYIENLDEYNKMPGYYAIKWDVVKKNPSSQATPTKTTLTLKKVTVKKSAKKLTIQATLKVNGKAVKGKIIKFAKTNAKGVAKITVKKSFFKKLKKGKKVTYTATYDKITKKVTVKVK